jgi:glycosyltransferase involved in cell wall biosynthesis
MKVLFLYNFDWSKEIADFERGLVPTHRLWGYADVARLGHDAHACPRPKQFTKLLAKPHLWRVYQALYALVHQRNLDCMVAVMETAAIPALALKRFGLLRTPIVILNMALLHQAQCSGFKKRLWRWLLPCAEAVVSLARAHTEWVAEEFGLKPERQHFIPMLVDTDYFKPEPDVPIGDFCLSVGTNDGKDFATLVKAFPKNEKLIVVTDGSNAEIIRREAAPDANIEVHQAIPIHKLRQFYKEAKVHIIPLADVRLGSGHTVLLENMALGKTLIVSKSPSMRDYLEDGVNCIAVEPHDVEELREKLRAFLEAPKKFAHLGPQAAEWARVHFSSAAFARKLLTIIEQIRADRLSPATVQPPAA